MADLNSGKPLCEAMKEKLVGLEEEIQDIMPTSGSLGITEEERIQIVTAMGLQKGHWFKCPKGEQSCNNVHG